MLGGELAVLQPPMFDGLSFDPFTLLDDGAGSAEVGVSGGHVAQRFVVALVVVVLDEGLDLGLEIAGEEVVFQQDAVLCVAT
jgi:gamma-glutamyltranspeptidase